MVPIAFHLAHLAICALSEDDRPCYRSRVLSAAFFQRKRTKSAGRQPPSISHSNTVALLVSHLPGAPWQTSPCRGCGQPTSSVLTSAGWVILLEKVFKDHVLVANFLSGSSVDQQFQCHLLAAQLLFPRGGRWLAVNLQDVIRSLWTVIFWVHSFTSRWDHIQMNSRKSYVLHEAKRSYSDEQTVKDFSDLDLWAEEIKSSTAYVWGLIRR